MWHRAALKRGLGRFCVYYLYAFVKTSRSAGGLVSSNNGPAVPRSSSRRARLRTKILVKSLSRAVNRARSSSVGAKAGGQLQMGHRAFGGVQAWSHLSGNLRDADHHPVLDGTPCRPLTRSRRQGESRSNASPVRRYRKVPRLSALSRVSSWRWGNASKFGLQPPRASFIPSPYSVGAYHRESEQPHDLCEPSVRERKIMDPKMILVKRDKISVPPLFIGKCRTTTGTNSGYK